MRLSISTTALLKNITEAMNENVVDAACVALGCDYETYYRVDYPDVSPDEFVRENTWMKEQYQVEDWSRIKEELRQSIKTLKDDDIELGRYIRSLLHSIEDILLMFYSSAPPSERSVFQKIIPYLRYHYTYDELPQAIVDIHKEYIQSSIQFQSEDAPEDPEAELKKRCEYTLQQLNHTDDIPCVFQCLYFHMGVFKRLAVIIESLLLEYHCRKDLFAYQKECDIILFPQIHASDIGAETDLTTEYIIENWTDGYTILDAYTEFANYGIVKDRVSAFGVDYVGIPELDAIMDVLADNKCTYYPKHHFERNQRRFEMHCKELAESKMPEEERKAKLVNIVQVLCVCYTGFLHFPELNEYLAAVIVFFSVVERAFMKAHHQICVKKVCMELGCEDLLTDEFPSTEYHNKLWEKRGHKPEGTWSEYYLKLGLQSTLSYHETRLCSACDKANCQFRKAKSKNTVTPDKGKLSNKEKQDQLLNGLRLVCRTMEEQPGSKVKACTANGGWMLNRAGQLYAYIGYALKVRYNVSKIPWQEMSRILRSDCDSGYLKAEASKIADAVRKGNIDALPDGYKNVDAAISQIAA